VIALAVVAALGTLIYVGRLWAQQTAVSTPAMAAEPRTRIALLNLTYVVKNYNRYQAFQQEIKKAIEPYQQRDADKKKLAESLIKEREVQTTPADRRDVIEKQLRDLQHDIEENKMEAKKMLDKKSDEQLKILYMDVRGAAHRYALAHNFELVLHYNDATTEADYNSPANIARKMQSGACMPLYAAPGMDISNEVVAALNAAYPAAPGVVPTAGTSMQR
jgi:Skp family chaperone for outer membrane proteins